VRAGCNRAASQVVQLVDYMTLHDRRNLQEEVSVLESSESFNCTHCAFYGFAQKEWRPFRDWVVAIHRLDNKPPVIMAVPRSLSWFSSAEFSSSEHERFRAVDPVSEGREAMIEE